MVVYTLEQPFEILRHYFENHGNVAECVGKLRTEFGRREAPSAPYVRYLVEKVKETGILIDKPKAVRTPENIAAVACDRLTEDANFGKKKIIFAAHFDLGGNVNKHLGHRKPARIH